MNVFLSWSGDRSRQLAEALREWLPLVLQTTRPWLSETDIDKGMRWADETTRVLAETGVGILCLTRDNLTSQWIHFEAGALSKTLDSSLVCALLLDVMPSDLTPPLSLFQHTRLTREDLTKLVRTLHRASASRSGTPLLSDDQLREMVSVWWPKLQERVAAIAEAADPVGPVREDREVIDEILETVRALRKATAESGAIRIARARLAELAIVKQQELALVEAIERELESCLAGLASVEGELAEADSADGPNATQLRELLRRERERRLILEARLRAAKSRQGEVDVRERELQKLAAERTEAG